MRRKGWVKTLTAISTIMILILSLTFSEDTTLGNNLSFPVFAKDGMTISPIVETLFTTVYATIDDVDWYAQKVEGNVWQADYNTEEASIFVDEIDWGDSLETVLHKKGSSVRLELTLYEDLKDDVTDVPMTAYTMAVLANPSSPDEIQGTDTTTYDAIEATIVTDQGHMIVQYLGRKLPTEGITWDTSEKLWEDSTGAFESQAITFGPELNVGGKYIFGAAQGAWKPSMAGWYRLTFYTDSNSEVKFMGAQIRKPSEYLHEANVDGVNNLTYIDIEIVESRTPGGNKRNK